MPARMARNHAPGRPWTTARLTTQPRVDPEIPCRSGRNPGPEGKSGPKVLKTPRWSAVRRNRSSKDRCVLGFEHATRNHAPLRRSASSFVREQMEKTDGKLRQTSAREREKTWLFDNWIWWIWKGDREPCAVSLRLILRSIAQQRVSKDAGGPSLATLAP